MAICVVSVDSGGLELLWVTLNFMADGYTKLFSDIVDSSIWDEDLETRVVWVTLLALSNADGLVRGSVGWLAGKSRVSVDACSRALKKFESPDAKSRTPANEGRRIERLDDGWLILNYLMFRDRLSTNPIAIKTRERVRLHRERYSALRNVTSVTPVHSASASDSVFESVSGYEPLPANLERVRKSLNELFKRNGRPWTYEEESTLAEICRSGEAENELASILVLRQKMSMEDRHFFPRSIIAVLRGWSKLLDTAAIYEAPKTPEQQKALQAALARWR